MGRIASNDLAIQEYYRRQELDIDAAHESNGTVAAEGSKDTLIKRNDQFWLKALRMLAQYHGNRDMALSCFLYAIGFGEMEGSESAVSIAIRHFKTPKKKAAVSKCIQMFRDCLNLPPAPGQRSERGRMAMSQARKQQLNGKPHGNNS